MESKRCDDTCHSIIALASLHTEALSVMIWIIFWGPTSLMQSLYFDAMNSLFFFLLSIHGVLEHWATLGARHEINDGPSVRIRLSITTNGDHFSFQVPLIGSNNLSAWAFSCCKGGPQWVEAGWLVADDWIACGICKRLDIIRFLWQVKCQSTGVEHPCNRCI